MDEKRMYTRAEKLMWLEVYQDALDNAPDTVDVLLEEIGIPAARLARWRAQKDRGILRGDGEEQTPALDGDGSIFLLGRLLRSVLTQGRATDPVPVGSAAGRVIYDESGDWRADYLARARSALTSIFRAFAADPAAVISPNVPTTPAEAVEAVRAAWGLDQLPRIQWDEGVNAESADRLVLRWAKTMCANPLAYEALRNWYSTRSNGDAPRPVMKSTTPWTWVARTEMWPPSTEGEWARGAARRLIGERPDLVEVLGENAQLNVVLRMAIAKVDAYVKLGEGYGGMKIFFQQHVVRPWQGYTMKDLRTPAEKRAGIQPRRRDERIVAAVVAMCFYEVFNDWNAAAAQKAIDRIFALQQPGGTDRPEQNYRARAVASRQAQARLPKIQKVVRKEHPAYLKMAHKRVFELFCAAERLQLAPGRIFADAYIATRRSITADMVTDQISRMVAILADLAANLAIAPPRVRSSLTVEQVKIIRVGLERSARSTPFVAAGDRNDALGLQKRDYDGAITKGVQGLNVLRKQRADDSPSDRDMLIMEEQLEMNLAGSAVQWIEELLSGDGTWQRQVVPPDQWERFGNFAVHHATNAVAIIETLRARGELEGTRYHDGFLADANFVYRAHDILYRCTGAAAVAALTFPFGESGRGEYLLSELEEIHLGVTTIAHPIAPGELPRLMHSMLLHSFLMGGVLPALQYEDLNRSLFDKDALTRVLEPEEIGDRSARTVMTYDRIALLTDWLIAHKWNAGWIGSVAEDSPVWRTLDERSGGLYKVWREDFDELLSTTQTRTAKRPSSGDYSFHTSAPKPTDLDVDGGPRVTRSDWGGTRPGLIPPRLPKRRGDERERSGESE